jgi:O-antigen ligase
MLQLYVVVLVLIPPTYVIEPLGGIGTPATVVGLVCLCLWGLALLTPGQYLRRTNLPVRIVMGALIGTIVLSYTVLHEHWVPGPELLSSDRMLLQVLSWIGVALLAAEGLRDREDVMRVLRTLVGAVAIMAVIGVLQFYAGIDLAELASHVPGVTPNSDLLSIQARSGFRRPAGTATHPIEFGCVIAMALPLALHLARFDLARSKLRRWLPLLAIAAGIPVAVSRSAIVCGLAAFVVVFVGLEPKHRPRALTAMGVFAIGVYATTPGLLGTIRDLFLKSGSDTSISTRTDDYQVVAEYVRQSPLFGRGPGTFLPTYRILDNQYLLSAIEIGLTGVAIVAIYLLSSFFLGRGARLRSEDAAGRDLGQAMAAAGLAAATAAFTFDGFSFLMYAGLVPLCLGVTATFRKVVMEHRLTATAAG